MKTLVSICWTALPLLLCAPCAALAQDAAAPAGRRPDEAPAEIAFSADQLVYEETADTVTATGEVRMSREGYHLRADSVSWNRVSGEVRANGNVRVVSPEGDVAYGDSVVLEDTLRDGVVENLLLVLADGGRLAADRATRENGYTTLDRAAYTACAVTSPDGCPKDPTWQINAVRVVHDPVRHRISYRGALAQPVRHADPRSARPLASRRQPGRRQRPPRPRDQPERPERDRALRALLHPPRAQSRRDDHAARLFRRAADASRPNIAS